jgi:hypothetical protein
MLHLDQVNALAKALEEFKRALTSPSEPAPSEPAPIEPASVTGPPVIDLMALDPLTVVSPVQAAAALGFSLDTLKRAHRDGTGPRRVRLSKKRVGYLVRDLRDWTAKLSVA